MKLDCRACGGMTNDFLEDRLDVKEASAFLEHIDECAACREELKTAYLISYALNYMDKGGSGAIDIDQLFEDMLKKSQQRCVRRKMTGAAIWIGVAVLSAVIAAFVIIVVIPGFFPHIPGPWRVIRRFILDVLSGGLFR